ncbi:MAG: ABC transporter permease subunit, partial [Treponema sp.]|nr:ABC transporter permease subunit [Treponema sp.]
MAFLDFNPVAGYAGSRWVGFENFQKFFSSYVFLRLILNTVGLSLYQLIAGFPIPIILAICINELKNRGLKKTVQMVTYAPHFISMVVMVSIMIQVFSTHGGFVNIVISALGGTPVNFMGKPEYFKSMYVWTGIWQNTGYSAIIYIAALSGIDPQIQEAAVIDGASKIQRIWHIDLPGIMPTAVILLILNCGRIMSVGFEKAFLMQNSMNISASEIISTYVYKIGLQNGDFAYSTTVNLFNSVINFTLLVAVNKIAN